MHPLAKNKNKKSKRDAQAACSEQEPASAFKVNVLRLHLCPGVLKEGAVSAPPQRSWALCPPLTHWRAEAGAGAGGHTRSLSPRN